LFLKGHTNYTSTYTFKHGAIQGQLQVPKLLLCVCPQEEVDMKSWTCPSICPYVRPEACVLNLSTTGWISLKLAQLNDLNVPMIDK